MVNKILYVLVVPENAETRTEDTVRRNVASPGLVSGPGTPSSEAVSLEPGERLLVGWYRGQYADEMAQEFEELFSAQDIGAVPLRGDGGSLLETAYYTLDNVQLTPPDPREQRIQQFEGVLKKTGSRRSHWRSVETNAVQVDNDFGNDTTGYVGVPSTATKIRWFNPADLSRDPPTLVKTVSGEHMDIEIYDEEAASFSNPVLIYDVDYADEGKGDAKVWDDHGRSETTTTANGDTLFQWQRVFDTKHEFSGTPIVGNNILRLTFDEGSNAITAERWSSGSSSYSSVTLGTSDWELFDLDILRISMARISAQVEFRDTTQSPTAYYSLNMDLKRGYENAQWSVPPNETGPTPSGLVTRLDPIANTSVIDPQESKGLTARAEVRK